MQELKAKLECTFNGYTSKKNGDIDLKFKCPYSELANVMSLVRMINCNITVAAKVNSSEPIRLGVFYLNRLQIDHDGESSIVFNTEVTSAEVNNFLELIKDEAIIHIMCKATVED